MAVNLPVIRKLGAQVSKNPHSKNPNLTWLLFTLTTPIHSYKKAPLAGNLPRAVAKNVVNLATMPLTLNCEAITNSTIFFIHPQNNCIVLIQEQFLNKVEMPLKDAVVTGTFATALLKFLFVKINYSK
jgi:hypothetical protein